MKKRLTVLGLIAVSMIYVPPAMAKLLVTQGMARGHRYLAGLMLFRMLCMLSACFFLPDMAWPLAIVVAFFGVTWAMAPRHLASTYLDGWMDARRDMIGKLQDADSLHGWINSMMIYDGVHILGLSVDVPDTPEGLDD